VNIASYAGSSSSSTYNYSITTSRGTIGSTTDDLSTSSTTSVAILTVNIVNAKAASTSTATYKYTTDTALVYGIRAITARCLKLIEGGCALTQKV
jgi:hypothetical protein